MPLTEHFNCIYTTDPIKTVLKGNKSMSCAAACCLKLFLCMIYS